MGKRLSLALTVTILFLSLWIQTGCEMVTTTGPRAPKQEVKRPPGEPQKRQPLYITQQEEMIKSVGSRLLAQLEKPMHIDFQILEAEQVNAGATFGKIIVTTGMMNFIKSDDELAVVLGHEITHIGKNHVMKSVLSGAIVDLGSLAVGQVAPGSEELFKLAGSVFAMKFSRDMEREADDYGLLYAHNAGFDVEKGIDIWERFITELPESKKAGLLSSHPASTERLARARNVASTLKQKGKLENPYSN